MLYWKIDVLKELKAAGWSSYRLRQERKIGERVIQRLRLGQEVSWETLGRICYMLNCDVDTLLTAYPSNPGNMERDS